MESIMINSVYTSRCLNIDAIKDEAYQLVHQGLVSRYQPIYNLCQYISPCEWIEVERELELHGFLLRDSIDDLISQEQWTND